MMISKVEEEAKRLQAEVRDRNNYFVHLLRKFEDYLTIGGWTQTSEGYLLAKAMLNIRNITNLIAQELKYGLLSSI